MDQFRTYTHWVMCSMRLLVEGVVAFSRYYED